MYVALHPNERIDRQETKDERDKEEIRIIVSQFSPQRSSQLHLNYRLSWHLIRLTSGRCDTPNAATPREK